MMNLLISTLFLVAGTSARTITGTNIGGWMVLEPWIVPSLFYRFTGKPQNETAIDPYTVCETLGPVEGNKLMRAHWETWYTESIIANLSTRGVEMVRLPVGDWTLNQYGPYIGCMDGAADYIDWLFETCAKYNITILMDVHCRKDSQNGFDNSGQAK
jgi:glucan 1,3-beta-glucosidase